MPIAYPDTKDYFVLMDLANHSLQKAVGEQAFADLKLRYAANGIVFSKRKLWNTPFFAAAATTAAASYSIPRGEVNVMILAPRQVMNYMAWKALKVLKDYGFDPAKVRSCHARFDRTSDGGWVLNVSELTMKTEQSVG